MNNTIFDDVFRTMIEKMPYLAVPLINEVFHTSYPEDVKITQLRNEHQQEDGEIITDSCLLIGKKMYHIECQSTDDTTMVIRMIEYDFAIGIEHAEKQGRRIQDRISKVLCTISKKFWKYAGPSGSRCSFFRWKYIHIFHTDYKNG